MKKLLILSMTIVMLTGCSLYKEKPIEKGNEDNTKNVLKSEEALEIVKEKYALLEESYTELGSAYPIINKENTVYYTLTNYADYFKIYSDESLENYKKDNSIIESDGIYYTSKLPRTKLEYDEISYTEISITETKIQYNILLYKCTETEVKDGETVCKNTSLKTNKFTLEKSENEWKISEYEMK